MPILALVGWTVYVAYYRPNWAFRNYRELAFVERIRGWTYFIILIPALLVNGVLTYIELSIVAILSGIVFLSLLLSLVVRLIPRVMFENETRIFSPSQREDLFKVMREVGSASIYLSMCIVTSNLGFLSFETNFLIVIISVSSDLILLYLAVIREKASRPLASKLAKSLEDSRWWRRYSGSKKKQVKK